MNQKRLFRPEVFESRKISHYGSVFINTPVHYMVLTVGIVLLVIAVFIFLMKAEFSEKFIVKGYLESAKGMARVYPSKKGVIEKCYIKQGDNVKKGDRLFLIDTSTEGLAKKNQDVVLAELFKRKQSINDELDDLEKQLLALKPLLNKKYIPLQTYNDKHAELLALQRQKNATLVDIINLKHSKSYVIRAPIDGLISSVIYQEGQYINSTKPLIKILPKESDLIAKLYIPVRYSGFLEPDLQVIIRYDAYPHARFGTSKGSIFEFTQSILTDDEEEKPLHVGHPYYKVSALLYRQFVSVYGKERRLQHGMTISAVIVGSKRRVWQWILDPIYSFYGELFL